MIKTPAFWYQKRGLLSYALWPVALVYQLGHIILQKLSKDPYNPSIPVICIANAVAGGSGKTPTAIALANLIKEKNLYKNPVIITRGYGRKTNRSALVDLNKDTFDTVGDEALLLAQHAPVIVGSNRAESARFTIEQNADCIIMDDGFFNTSIEKDINILVVDRQMDFGNGLTLPAGPLRAPLKTVLPDIDAIITIGPSFLSDKPVFEAEIQVSQEISNGTDVIAFAGIGYPQKFKNTLEDNDYSILSFHAFADHHVYSENDLKPLLESAKEKKARLITTEKDFVRLPAHYKEMVDTLPIQLSIHDEDGLINLLKEEAR
ncbi:MAG: tetraacyldisaccharide 4'-kinase [Pseudomonadota bacterium]